MPTIFYNDVLSNDILVALGGTPAAGDSVSFSRDSVKYTNSLPNLAAIDLLAVKFGAGYTGDIEAAPFKFVCDRTSTGLVTVNWGGRTLKLGSSSNAAIIYQALIDPVNGGTVHWTDCRLKNLLGKGGATNVWDSVDLDNCRVSGGAMYIAQSNANPTVDLLTVSGGVCETLRDFTDGVVSGGELRMSHKDVTPSGTLTVSGGTVRFGTDTGPMGLTCGTMIATSGVLDFSRLARPLTFGASTLGAAVRIINPSDPSLIAWGTCTLPDIVDPRQAR